MLKALALLGLMAAVYGVRAHSTQSILTAEETSPHSIPSVDATGGATVSETDQKNEDEQLEGAEFGWGWKKWGWGFPSYRSYYYPSYYNPSYYYPSYSTYWW